MWVLEQGWGMVVNETYDDSVIDGNEFREHVGESEGAKCCEYNTLYLDCEVLRFLESRMRS